MRVSESVSKDWSSKYRDSRIDELEKLILNEERQIKLLKNSSWVGKPPSTRQESILESLYFELAQLAKDKETK